MTMREILFRGKRLDDSGWVRGFLVGENSIRWCDGYFGCEKTDGSMQQNVLVSFVVYPDTIGQFTGLTDKNGKEIFEGDVIRAHYANVPPERCEHIEKVVFRKGRFCGMYENGTMKTWAGLPDGTQHLPGDRSVWMDWCEVIGTIHDNPELLEDK